MINTCKSNPCCGNFRDCTEPLPSPAQPMTPTDNLEAGAGDLVARLRSRKGEAITRTERLMDEAADYIEEAAAQLAAVTAENARLRGLLPELPPYPPEGGGLPRYGLRWNGPDEPLATPMGDGYWTPYHLADQYRRYYYEAGEELSEVAAAIGITRWMDPPDGGDVSLAEQVRRMKADLAEAEAQIKASRAALRHVEEWWLTDGMNHFNGAPYAIFAVPAPPYPRRPRNEGG